ncbi:MAG: hypothetical protein IKO49_01635 [Bacilli bacterium]|nr:hypothetical protein [Clostridia bacterium]MBR4618002.1 hypothetical protein [Bacilli bacterium]
MSKNSENLLTVKCMYNGKLEKHPLLLKCITEILDKIRQEKDLDEQFYIKDTDIKCYLATIYKTNKQINHYYVSLYQYPGQWYNEETKYELYITKENAENLYLLSRININCIIPYIKITN